MARKFKHRVVVEIVTESKIKEEDAVRFVDRCMMNCNENVLYDFEAGNDTKLIGFFTKRYTRLVKGLIYATRANKK